MQPTHPLGQLLKSLDTSNYCCQDKHDMENMTKFDAQISHSFEALLVLFYYNTIIITYTHRHTQVTNTYMNIAMNFTYFT